MSLSEKYAHQRELESVLSMAMTSGDFRTALRVALMLPDEYAEDRALKEIIAAIGKKTFIGPIP